MITPHQPRIPKGTKLAHLALYLAHNIEVHSDFFGRGVLLGLPFVQPWDRSPNGAHAHVHFDHPPPNEVCSGVQRVCDCKPVLYAPKDAWLVAHTLPSIQRTGAHVGLASATVDELDRMARIVDTARSMGIALNMPEGTYIRKELPTNQSTNETQETP